MVWLPSTPVVTAPSTPSRHNSDASLSLISRQPSSFLTNEKPDPSHSWTAALSPSAASRKYFDKLPFASQLSASTNSGRLRVRIIALIGLVLATVLILAIPSSQTFPDASYASSNTIQTSPADASKAKAQIAQLSSNNLASDNLYAVDEDDQASTYLGYAKKFAHNVKDEFTEYYEAAASVAGEVADKAHKILKWSDIDDYADSTDDEDGIDASTELGHAGLEKADGWLWHSNGHKGKANRKLSQYCIPPIRADFQGDPSEHSPLQRAFVKSWKNVCRLDQDKFTIIMTSSNSRVKVVRKNLQTWLSSKIPSLAEVYIRWIGDLPTEPLFNETSPTILPGAPSVRFYQNHNGSLNNRWAPIPGLKTAYVFSHDDDMEIDTTDFEWAWQMAKMHKPAFTSFVGRRFDLVDDDKDGKAETPVYRVGAEGESYAMGTSASFAHASFMDIWSHDFLTPVRELVDETKNCEDMAMAFLIPYITRLAPLIVEGKNKILHWQFHKDMVSGDAAHWHKRDICGKAFLKLFGEMPPEREYTIVKGLTAGDRKIRFEHVY